MLLVAMLSLLAGCGDKNPQALFSPDSGVHPGGWVKSHKTVAALGTESCVECHGASLEGGVSQVSCMSPTALQGFKCHVTSPADNPSGCVSCHGGPPFGPFGDSAPNRNYAHTKCTVVSSCTTCHLGAGYGTADHASASATGGFRPATVKMTDNVKAQTITTSFSYDPQTQKCFGVSCHGGLPSTPWNEKITLVAGDNSVCFGCHTAGDPPTTVGGSPSPQYNSFYSGTFGSLRLHSEHLKREKYCTNCHNILVQMDYQMHFSGIAVNNATETATDRFVDPGRTIGGKPTSIGSYDKTTKTCSNVSCHPSVWGSVKWND